MSEVRAFEVAANRRLWALMNERFTDAAAEELWLRPSIAWGLFRAQERDVRALGEIDGLDVVELACGTAYFSAWMARAGARPVALDLSAEQLATARRLQALHGPSFPLVQADAEHVPLDDASFDLVVSEHGAGAWCEPSAWVREAARLLRPGGRLVFLTNSQLCALCVPEAEGIAGDRLLRGYRDVARIQWPGGGVEFHPSHGDWIRLLRSCGFVVEAMHELFAPDDGAQAPYEIVNARWATQWPAEELWAARKG